ncbi:MAG: hypothetical protein V3V08_16580 [Nannocystaceae bacterium]
MGHRYAPKPTPDASTTEAALDAMDAAELRALIRDIIPWLDESTHARLVNALVDRAARNSSGWVPEGPNATTVSNIMTFAEAAARVGHADPSEVDDYLRQGASAFLGKDYQAAFEIFRALLIPIGNVDIHIGQHEMIDEVLGVDVAACASQYVVSMYMTAMPQNRGKAVLSAIDEMQGVGHFWEPLREMERVAVEPLPELDDFLGQWRSLVEERTAKNRNTDWDSDEDRWLREVVARTEGPQGLAKVARVTRRAADLRAWCRALVETGDWKASLAAHDEAADLVTDKAYSRGDFLDGAALAAQELGRKDLPKRLERAWREAPSMVRLRRWLGTSKTMRVLSQRVAEAQCATPKQAHRQRALLHVLEGDFCAAAKLLAAAPGLGWSSGDHPGHLIFPLFCTVLGGLTSFEIESRDLDDLSSPADLDEPRLLTPQIPALLEQAAVATPPDSKTRTAVFKAMRKTAEKRIEGVTENKRRRHYEHAASLAAACIVVDKTPAAAAWMASLRDEYRRFPALQREFNRCEN